MGRLRKSSQNPPAGGYAPSGLGEYDSETLDVFPNLRISETLYEIGYSIDEIRFATTSTAFSHLLLTFPNLNSFLRTISTNVQAM